MVDPDMVSLNGLKAPGNNGVQIVEEKLAIAPPHGIPPSDGSRLTVGGGAGAVIVYLANHYATDADLKNLIVYLSPLLGIIIMRIYSFFAIELSKSWNSHQEERTRLTLLRRANDGLKVAKTQLASIEADPLATQEHKTQARAHVQLIEQQVLKLNVKGIVILD